MRPQLLPGSLKRAVDLLESDPVRAWTIGELALACGIGRRTLQRQFCRFVGREPMEFLLNLRLDMARQQLLRVSARVRVTDIAARSGFKHLGRFAAQYRERYGESPSGTLRRHQNVAAGHDRLPAPLSTAVKRPVIAVLPFDLIGADARRVAGIAEEITAALMRLRWIAVAVPARARYHLRGKVLGDGTGRLRATVMLLDALGGRYLWTDRWDGDCNDLFAFEERVAERTATAIQASVRAAEMDRASRQDVAGLNAWELTMRALPRVLSVDAAGAEIALELLERAMGVAPYDALPMALAAWCHGLRGGHNLCLGPDKEKATARDLARRAARLNGGDALTENSAGCRLHVGTRRGDGCDSRRLGTRA